MLPCIKARLPEGHGLDSFAGVNEGLHVRVQSMTSMHTHRILHAQQCICKVC